MHKSIIAYDTFACHVHREAGSFILSPCVFRRSVLTCKEALVPYSGTCVSVVVCSELKICEVANSVTLSLHSGRMHSAFFEQNVVGKRHTVYHDQMCHRSCCMQIQYLLVLLLSRHDKVSSEPAVSAATRSDHA